MKAISALKEFKTDCLFTLLFILLFIPTVIGIVTGLIIRGYIAGRSLEEKAINKLFFK